MRTVTARELAREPEGTIYSWMVHPPVVCEGLYRKGRTFVRAADGEPSDFDQMTLLPFPDEAFEGVRFDDAEGRWGLYEWEMQACIYEHDDLSRLQQIITEALSL